MRATDSPSLARVNDLLHDEVFELDDLRFDSDAQSVVIPVRRVMHSGAERFIKRGFASSTYEKDWMRSVVTVRGVTSWSAEHDPGIGAYSFLSWSRVDRGIRVECNQSLVLHFDVAAIDVTVEDTGFDGKARIKRGRLLGGTSMTSKVYT